MIMTAEPITLLDLAAGWTLLIAIVAIMVNVIALIKEVKNENHKL